VLEGRVVPATLQVMNNNDAGAGSLRAAVTGANNGDVIRFDNIPNQTITLTSGEILVTKNITLTAFNYGGYTITINGNTNSRIFEIQATSTVTISDLTLTNGKAANASGGAILNNGTLELYNTEIASCLATGNGGAILNSGNIDIELCYIHDNRAGVYGGGVANTEDAGYTNVIDTSVQNNSASDSGGGLYNIDFKHLDITQDSAILGNSAAKNGGGIFNEGFLDIESSTIDSNSAITYGGGIYAIRNSEITGSYTDFTFNYAGVAGDGLYLGMGPATLNYCTVSNNSAPPTAGAGIYYLDALVTLTTNSCNITDPIDHG
jgi:hypothetical protein